MSRKKGLSVERARELLARRETRVKLFPRRGHGWNPARLVAVHANGTAEVIPDRHNKKGETITVAIEHVHEWKTGNAAMSCRKS